MKDSRGATIEVGDTVVYSKSHYAKVYTGVVEKLTPKRVKVLGEKVAINPANTVAVQLKRRSVAEFNEESEEC